MKSANRYLIGTFFLVVGGFAMLRSALPNTALSCADASADEPYLEKGCVEAAKSMKQLENVVAFKLHAFTKFFQGERLVEQEVWLEGRNDKFWCQTLSVGEKDKSRIEKEIRAAEIVNADRKETIIFDGKILIQHRPIGMLVLMEDAEGFVGQSASNYLIPATWTNFSQSIQPGKYTYRYVLENSLAERTVKLVPNEKRIRVTYQHNPSKAFKFKWLEFDSSNFLVVASEESGGIALAHSAQYEWQLSNGSPFVVSGKVQLGDKIQFEWKIDSYTSNEKEVRQSFALDESKLPLGTRIEEDPHAKRGPRKIRFIGGTEGRREHLLRQEALKIALFKDGDKD